MKTDVKTMIHFIKNFRLNSIFIRNFVLIMLIMLLPLTVVGTLFYASTRQSIDNEMAAITQSNASTVKNVLDSIIRAADLLANQTALNQNVQSLCLSSYNNSNISNLYQNIRTYIRNFRDVYPYIHSIYIYSEKNNILIDNQEIFNLDDYEDLNWFGLYEKASTRETIITHRKKNDRYPRFISIIRSISFDNNEKIGCVVINLDVEQLNEVINDMEEISLHDTVILNENHQILLGREVTRVGSALTDYFGIKNLDWLQRSSGSVTLPSGEFLFAKAPSSHYGFSYLALVPRTSFSNIIISSFGFLGLIVILLFLAGIVITIFISMRTYTPIQRILNVLLPAQDPEAEGDDRQNEFTYITNTIKNTIDKNTELAEELNYRMLLLNRAQVYALQAQINPHFLNNTLEVINWTAIHQLGEKNKISEMIRCLSALFDVSLDSEHYLIPIEEELHHTSIYIYLMSLNYGSDLNFVWDMEEGISNYKILKLTLQPILENAVVHGISPKRGKGNITIRARFLEDDILITVSDDGIGMNPKELAALQNSLQTGAMHGKHVGIKNINQRIKLIFGEKYGVTITSEKDKGTNVNILIPKADI